jgi:hypothetical protein
MLLKKLKFVLLLLIAPMLFVACEDDDDDVSFDVKLLQDTKWVNVKLTVEYKSDKVKTFQEYDAKTEWDRYAAGGKYFIGKNGVEKEAGTWALSGSNLTTNSEEDGKKTAKIIKLTATELTLEVEGKFPRTVEGQIILQDAIVTAEYKTLDSL